ncbi:hypothetical protein Aeqsu_2176 [Aequorivita sublithincola DSM 14238]|uniref:Uncharacterized protein n=1 Tax=Aequorivita sublithincola (strain DSM 14238 / LMG 21431 / ACAM 643 / 9-3) TaxID=746697 RepID=I3YXB8_AEQSU|nr:hypothetical protein [Aequorivita sublithincola]AFL81636.1 hypothetical protein Aeqsu_2176 [Aequorivita sublithincola DSM 14238]
MMDELELLKKQWQNQEQELPHLSFNDIYKMLLKKSSSIVKWIFYISIAEILFWTLLAFLVPESSTKFTDDIGLHNVLIGINILNYTIFAVFIFLFYRNYRKISTTDSIKELMKNILQARKTVKYFVIYNVTASILIIIGVNIYYYLNQNIVFKYMSEDYGITNISQEQFMNMFFLIQVLFGLLMIAFVLVFYRLVYGILMKRLHRNYKELEKIEV